MSNNEANWVRNRAQCTIMSSFEVIAKAVEQNIGTFNSCSDEERDNRLYGHERRDQSLEVYSATKVHKHGGGIGLYKDENGRQNYAVRISCSDASIVVYRKDLPSIAIYPQWNRETLNCDLLVEEVAYSVSHISHMILCDILFDNQGQ